ncbi:hypothetical protein [Mycobacterium sp. PS03-16]|uniref:hypothetical protein n=1 Tax=Mycobacterium sp. PS03-16 TaxID=2559611 RepID=UPI001430494F|nr:hypothetical protein [Mycobacterium sp. PS03-16]
MTVLVDWLTISPVTPRTVRTLVCAPLRSVMPGRAEEREAPRLIRPGIERC